MATASFHWVDALLHGQLEVLLTKWRDEGKSLREIAAEVNDRLPEGSTIHYSTVSRWCSRRQIKKVEAA